MLKIALIGCTGSIGRQTADVVRRYPDRFCFSALACGTAGEELSALCREFMPRYALCAGGTFQPPQGVRALAEADAAQLFDGCDVALIAAGGFAGLRYTLLAAQAGRRIALANKESLVCGGELVTRTANAHGAQIVPVDSEHSAIFQCLSFRTEAPFERLILTASGGPFLHFTEEQLRHAKAADALRHPTWSMGAKITVDSATLLNKGYEVIEAHWLYHAPFEKIGAVVHPESIVHSLVYFADGASLAQLGYPDMRVPIQLALTYPERLPCEAPLDLAALGKLTFLPFPAEKFPCFSLAVAAGKAGGSMPTVLNAAAEEAVRAFLQDRITFPAIAETVKDALDAFPREAADDYGVLAETDARVRAHAHAFIYGKSAS